MASLFFELGIVLLIATAFALLANRLKQPMIPAYILAGLLLGPGLYYLSNIPSFASFFHLPPGLRIIHNLDLIKTLSEIGIAFMLFVVGLEIDFKRLKDVETVSTVGGTLQVVVLFILGFFLALLLGFRNIEAAYIGLIISFSSTMVVLKILSDKRELDTLHGRISIGILLIQDIVAVLALLILSKGNAFSFGFFFVSLIQAIILIVVVIFLIHTIFPVLFKRAAKLPELLFIVALSVCFLFSMLFSLVGFSISIGAFVAGIALGNLPYNFEIVGRIKALRDFFVILFFVSLGLQLGFDGHFARLLVPLFFLLFTVIILKPFIIMVIICLFPYTKRPAFLTAISLGQVSEFSLILVFQGLLLGQVSNDILTLTILLTIISVAFTSYFLKYEYMLYKFLDKDFAFFEFLSRKTEEMSYPSKKKPHAILCGYDRTGYSILKKLKKLKKRVIVVDYNPQIVKRLKAARTPCIYGDVANQEIQEQLPFKDIELVISTIPDDQATMALISHTKKENKKAIIIVTAYNVDDAIEMYEAGADYVIVPHFLGGEHVSLLLEDLKNDWTTIVKARIHHLRELKHRRKNHAR